MDHAAMEMEVRSRKIRRFSYAVSLVLMVLCNAVLVSGFKLSGINLDELFGEALDLYDPQQDVCLRLSWQSLAGASEPVRICSEWIRLSDPSGQPHHLKQDTKVKKGPDGQYYVDHEIQADYRLLISVLFVLVVIASGLWAKWFVVARYRLRVESTDRNRTSLVH